MDGPLHGRIDKCTINGYINISYHIYASMGFMELVIAFGVPRTTKAKSGPRVLWKQRRQEVAIKTMQAKRDRSRCTCTVHKSTYYPLDIGLRLKQNGMASIYISHGHDNILYT